MDLQDLFIGVSYLGADNPLPDGQYIRPKLNLHIYKRPSSEESFQFASTRHPFSENPEKEIPITILVTYSGLGNNEINSIKDSIPDFPIYFKGDEQQIIAKIEKLLKPKYLIQEMKLKYYSSITTLLPS